jgi:ketosteroid isomerase-like protein
MTTRQSPKQVLQTFYEAEAKYMQTNGPDGKAAFDEIAATLDPAVVLHQSPDLPFGGEYVGHKRYKEWAVAMRSIFDKLEVGEQEFFEKDDKVIVTCRFRTRSRQNGSVQDLPMVQIVTVKDGRITDFRPFYWNVPEYLAAAQTRKT